MKALVLCIDRDNDYGRKGGLEGPIIGKEDNVDAVLSLAKTDPEDSDVNVVLYGLKLYEEAKKEYDEAEIATLTGDNTLGIKSDKEIINQLDEVLNEYNAGGVILVSDGAEDEQVTPLITPKIPIISTKRVIVKQSQNIESTYYIIYKYFKEALSDPETARAIIGIPGLILLLFGLSTILSVWMQTFEAISPTLIGLVLTLLGGYAFIKGFELIPKLGSIIPKIRQFLTKEPVKPLTYLTGILIMLGGGVNSLINLTQTTLILRIMEFLNTWNPFFIIGLAMLALGHLLTFYEKTNYQIWRAILAIMYLPALWAIIKATTQYSMETINQQEIFTYIAFAIFWIAITSYLGLKLRKKLKKTWEETNGNNQQNTRKTKKEPNPK